MNNFKLNHLENVILTNSTGNQYTLRHMFLSFEIYESIFQPFLSGKLFIEDDVNFFNIYPLVGGELITISFSVNSEDEQFNQEYTNFKVMSANRVDTKHSTNINSRIYELSLTEQEGFNAINEFSISYNEKLISDIVKDISDNMIEKPILTENLEATKTKYSMVFPYMTPIEMIHYVSNKYAINSKNQYGYVYYTDVNQKVHYTSINTLLNLSSAYELNEHELDQDRVDVETMRHKSFEKYFNVYDNIKNGLFGNNDYYFDSDTKSVETIENSFDTFKGENVFLGTQYFADKSIKDYTLSEVTTDENNKSKNIMLYSMLDNYNIVVKQDGIFGKAVGMCADLFHKPQIVDESTIYDDTISGKWLSIKQIHKFDTNGYNIFTTFVKNAFDQKIDELDVYEL